MILTNHPSQINFKTKLLANYLRQGIIQIISWNWLTINTSSQKSNYDKPNYNNEEITTEFLCDTALLIKSRRQDAKELRREIF